MSERGNAKLNGAGLFECTACGATEAPPTLPMPLDEFTKALDDFVEAHRACKPAPRRVQLSRAAGWRMPPDTVKVDRSTQWGNPFVPGVPPADLTLYECLAKFERHALSLDLAPLAEKNLACWCPLGSPCHADILLLMANRTAEVPT